MHAVMLKPAVCLLCLLRAISVHIGAYRFGLNLAVPSKTVGAVSSCLTHSSSQSSDTQQRRKLEKMAQVFEIKSSEMVKNCTHSLLCYFS